MPCSPHQHLSKHLGGRIKILGYSQLICSFLLPKTFSQQLSTGYIILKYIQCLLGSSPNQEPWKSARCEASCRALSSYRNKSSCPALFQSKKANLVCITLLRPKQISQIYSFSIHLSSFYVLAAGKKC